MLLKIIFLLKHVKPLFFLMQRSERDIPYMQLTYSRVIQILMAITSTYQTSIPIVNGVINILILGQITLQMD